MADGSGHTGVVLICGIPASGKSTFATKLHQYVQRTMGDSIHTIHVCYDDLIPSDLDLYGSSDVDQAQNDLEWVTENSAEKSENLENPVKYSLWKQYRKYILEAVEKIMNLIENSFCENEDGWSGSNLDVIEETMEGLPNFREFWNIFVTSISREDRMCSCIDSGSSSWRWNGSAHVILVDDNMFYHSMRYEYVQLARKYSTGFAEVFLKCPLEIAEKRNSLRCHPVPSDTMQNMFSKMEPPEPDKFPWEKYSVTIKAEEQVDIEIMESVTQLVTEALKHPAIQTVEDFEEKEKSRMACITSIVYQADQVLRKYIAKVITEAKGSEKGKKELQPLAAQLNKQKKAFVESLHNIKSHAECSGNINRTVTQKQCYTGDNTESTSDNSRERTLETLPKESVTAAQQQTASVQENAAHFVNFVGEQSYTGNSRSHFCLCCFPNVEDKEEFRLFVEELFKNTTES